MRKTLRIRCKYATNFLYEILYAAYAAPHTVSLFLSHESESYTDRIRIVYESYTITVNMTPYMVRIWRRISG